MHLAIGGLATSPGGPVWGTWENKAMARQRKTSLVPIGEVVADLDDGLVKSDPRRLAPGAASLSPWPIR